MGGDLHTAAYRAVQVIAYIMPAALMYQFVQLFNAYDRTVAEDEAADTAACGAGDCLSNSSFYFKPYVWDDSAYAANPYGSIFVLTTKYYYQFVLLVSAIFASVSTSYWTFGNFEKEYNQAVKMSQSNL
jgi:hypothetical protein